MGRVTLARLRKKVAWAGEVEESGLTDCLRSGEGSLPGAEASLPAAAEGCLPTAEGALSTPHLALRAVLFH